MSINEKPTVDLDQFQIIRGLLERQEAKVDALRAEGAQRGAEQAAFNAKLEANQTAVQNEVRNLNGRVMDLTGRVTKIEKAQEATQDRVGDVNRRTSEADLAHEAAIAGAVAHVAKIEATQTAQNEKLDGLTTSVEALTKAQAENTAVTVETKEETSKKNGKAQWTAIALGVLAAITAIAQAIEKAL